jgi:hypothetical protein
MNSLERKYCLLPLLFLFCTHCWGTTAIVLITPQRIIVGTDRLGLQRTARGAFKKREILTKTVLVKGRFSVSCVHLEQLLTDSGVSTYTFVGMMNAIDSQLGHDARIPKLVSLIETESAHTFRDAIPVERLMQNGTIKRSESFDKFLEEYVVAGYDNGIPTIIRIYYAFDWNSYKLIGPLRQIEFPKAERADTYFYAIGGTAGLSGIQHNPYSAEFTKFLSGGPITSIEGIKIMRSLIAIETKAEPSKVGLGATVVAVPRDGYGTIREYGALSTPTEQETTPQQ